MRSRREMRTVTSASYPLQCSAYIDVELSIGRSNPSRHRASPLNPQRFPPTRYGATPITEFAPSVDAAEPAVVPRGAVTLDELEADALGGLLRDRGATLAGKLRRRLHAARDGMAQHDLLAERRHGREVPGDDHVALQRDPAQLRVALAGLHLHRGALIALEVAHLLRGGVGPRPQART